MGHDDVRDLISVPEAARRAGVARNTIHRAAKSGSLRAIKPGRNWLVFSSDIDRWKREEYRPDMAHRYPVETDEQDDGHEYPTEH